MAGHLKLIELLYLKIIFIKAYLRKSFLKLLKQYLIIILSLKPGKDI